MLVFMGTYILIGVIISAIVYTILKLIDYDFPDDAFFLIPVWSLGIIIGFAWLLGNFLFGIIEHILDKEHT